MLKMKCIVFVAALLLLSCGNPPKKSSPIQNGNCGNGQLDPGEACDPAIATGEGVCPTAATCNAMGCGASYSGNPASCDAQCAAPTCGDDDSCCPSGCDSTNDPQCTNTCGNGAVEEGETCDGDCPATCDDRNACTIDAFTGAAETCNIA